MPEAQVSGTPQLAWVPPTGALGELTRASERRAERAAAGSEALESAVARLMASDPDAAGRASRFAAALRGAPGTPVAVIAEVKRRSPSKGAINEGIRAPERAAEYARGGAAAISVLTEPERFGGTLDDLRDVCGAVSVPVLRKDFIVHRVQLLEARQAGADAVLLIARALPPGRLLALAAEAASLGLGVLAEVRSADELAVALAIPGAVIGVNNRDLETLVIEPEVGARLIPGVPRDRVAVHESGVASVEDVLRAAAAGADAVLVGSILSRARDGAAAVSELAHVPRAARG